MAQLVSAPPCHGGGRGFESHSGRLYATAYITLVGVLAQLGEHLPYKQRVIGSSPIGPTFVRVAQLDRASDYGSEGREFESSRVHSKKVIKKTPEHSGVFFL